ncbi:2-amino-4-hydroxy-6-hydroxymethyldihydropteridine diphosphokinase [Glycomyces xiaoerkulensis]|uniref:2-amino-4-hydroxy-6- hydroxymethyldihydropteridine diphosphokinase n=1 Tax=Glycomyces xiaoerkulensis TaxID=2038139 RepID=UPI000C267F4D|nr:2-amino-4-hydroxy-6-hydroxymethyldihydropteridine diphosphokinase [Glycomyces xiaoerkulensis]
MSRVVLSLGSNLGDREAHLADAVDALAPDTVSDLYETPPWGGDDDQPTYYNLTAVATAPGRSADAWLETALDLENDAGRVRDPDRPFGPRTLDVDLIAAWDDDGRPVHRTDPRLELPHPRAHLRAFVLVPWLAVDRDAELPGHGPVRELLREEALAEDARALRRLHPLWSEHHE